MTIHIMSAAEKIMYSRGALPWNVLVQQCTVQPKRSLALIVPLPVTKQDAAKLALHEKYKKQIVKLVNEEVHTISTLVRKLGIARTAVQEYCRSLVASKEITYQLGMKQVRYYYPTKGESK